MRSIGMKTKPGQAVDGHFTSRAEWPPLLRNSGQECSAAGVTAPAAPRNSTPEPMTDQPSRRLLGRHGNLK
jgi:hypothetical protein